MLPRAHCAEYGTRHRAGAKPATGFPSTALRHATTMTSRTALARPPFFERHKFLLLFALLSTLMGTSVGMAKVATSLYALHLQTPAALLGFIASAQMVGVLFMSLPIGFLVDQWGPRKLFTLGTVVAGLIYVVLPLVASPWFLLACTAAISFFMPFRFVSLNTVFMQQLETVGEARAGWYRGTHMTGMFLLGPVIAAGAVTALGFAGTYWSIAALFALTILVCPIVFGPYAVQAKGGARLTPRAVIAQLGLLGSERELRTACLIEFFGQGCNAFYSFFIVIIAINGLHLDAAAATRLIGIEGLTFIAALFSLGSAMARIGAQRGYVLSLSLAALASALLGFGHASWALLGGGALLGLALGTLQIINLTRFARIGARLGRGKIAGLNALAGPAGSFTGSLLGGALGELLGLQSVFLVFAGGFAVLATRFALRDRHAVTA
ncbi:MFS transporter [Uliginosibacterium sp. H3]|uniref:MFS transporter n=1 Tax=Uliginosibacterium silvisoli TaxID=3114758 RepID=A0ABU6K780_9RHOO|nr:MFS transporter [Uliginosibacterium sp. H3]